MAAFYPKRTLMNIRIKCLLNKKSVLQTSKHKEKKLMRMKAKKSFILLLSTLLFSISSNAEQAGKSLKEKLENSRIVIHSSVRGCDEDIKKHCDGLGNEAGKVFMCLAAYEQHLSEKCKSGILEAAMSVRIGAAALSYSVASCEADVDNHCADVQPGDGRLVSCIKANKTEVSEKCITALKETGLWKMGN